MPATDLCPPSLYKEEQLYLYAMYRVSPQEADARTEQKGKTETPRVTLIFYKSTVFVFKTSLKHVYRRKQRTDLQTSHARLKEWICLQIWCVTQFVGTGRAFVVARHTLPLTSNAAFSYKLRPPRQEHCVTCSHCEQGYTRKAFTTGRFSWR